VGTASIAHVYLVRAPAPAAAAAAAAGGGGGLPRLQADPCQTLVCLGSRLGLALALCLCLCLPSRVCVCVGLSLASRTTRSLGRGESRSWLVRLVE
jgi:hypothetical protein